MTAGLLRGSRISPVLSEAGSGIGFVEGGAANVFAVVGPGGCLLGKDGDVVLGEGLSRGGTAAVVAGMECVGRISGG